MKKWKYFLTASVLAGVLFTASPGAVFAAETGAGQTESVEQQVSGTSVTESTDTTDSSVTGEEQATTESSDTAEPAQGSIGRAADPSSAVPDSSWKEIGTGEQDTDAYAKQTVEDGTYLIAMASDGFKVLKNDSDGIIRLDDADGSSAQRFRVAWNSSGSYYTLQSENGSYLAAEGSYEMTYARISGTSTTAGAWYIVPDGQGHYSIVAKKSGMAAEALGSGLVSGTGICLAAKDDSAIQKFSFVKAADSEDVGEGYYEILSASDSSKAADIEAANVSPGTNLQLSGVNGTDAQKFVLQNSSNGTYTIRSLCSGMYIEAAGTSSGANVRQAVVSGGAAQRWIVKEAGDGTYYIRSAANSSQALTITGSNLQIGTATGGNNQKFILRKTSYTPVTGTYFLASQVNTQYVVDIYSGSRKMQANADLYANNGTNAQKFVIVDKGNGFVSIRNVQSKHVLDVAGGSTKDGANIWQYRENGSAAQLFTAHKNSDGSYTFVNAASGKVIDIAGGRASNGVNVQQYSYNGSAAQKFVLQATSGSDNQAIDYSIYEPPKTSVPSGSGSPLVRDSIDQKAQGYSSATGYEILVNRSNHTVSIYTGSKGNWTRIKRFACGDGKPSTPTIEGVFSVGIKEKSFGHGYTCWYATQIRGNYLFHSVLYYPGSMTRIKDGRLGMGVSHGCVRLAIENAKWIYDNIPRSTRIVIYH